MNESDEQSDDDASDSDRDESDHDMEAEDSESSVESNHAEAGPSKLPQQHTSSARKGAVWTDPSTSSLLVPLVGPNARATDGTFAGTKRLRKLRVSNDEREITGQEYEKRLREQYEKLRPRPAWASRVALGSTRLLESGRTSETERTAGTKEPSIEFSKGGDITLEELLSRDTGLVARVTGSAKSRTSLPSGQIEVERLRDVHSGVDDPDLQSAIECLDFHPVLRSTSRLLLTASRDRRLRLYNVDGGANALLQTIHVPSLPISTARFHPNGTSVLLAGPRPFLYSYDLQSGRVVRSSPWRGALAGGSIDEEDAKERDLSMARFQPLDSAGSSRLLAIGGRRGAVHLVDWARSGGASGGNLISSLRQNSPLAGVEWDPSSEAEGRRLVSLGQDGTMSLWDVRNMRCSVVKRDLGLYGARSVAASNGGGHWAVGSDSGIVNVYRGADLQPLRSTSSTAPNGKDAPAEESIEAVKSISNLVTSTSILRFNPASAAAGGDSQIMALASRNKKDALRLVHTGSLTVFSNWPTSGTPLGHVSDVAFDPSGRFLAVGNTRGRTLLYGLNHFSA